MLQLVEPTQLQVSANILAIHKPKDVNVLIKNDQLIVMVEGISVLTIAKIGTLAVEDCREDHVVPEDRRR